MRYLVTICKDVKEYVPKVTDILAQMLQVDEAKDQSTASFCLMQLWSDDPIKVLKTLFNHIHTLTDQGGLKKCIDFIYKRLVKPIASQSAEIENIVVEESKKVIQVCYLT